MKKFGLFAIGALVLLSLTGCGSQQATGAKNVTKNQSSHKVRRASSSSEKIVAEQSTPEFGKKILNYVFYQKPWSNSYKGLDDIPTDHSYIYMTFGTDNTFTRHSVIYINGQDGQVQVLDTKGNWSFEGEQLSTKTTDQRIVLYENSADFNNESIPEEARHDQGSEVKVTDEDLVFKVQGNTLKQTTLQGSLDEGDDSAWHKTNIEPTGAGSHYNEWDAAFNRQFKNFLENGN